MKHLLKHEGGYVRHGQARTPTQTRRMTKITHDEACKKILYHYGVQRQKLKLVEEMGELIQAIAKSPENMITDNIVNEIANVQIIINQMCVAMSQNQNELLNDMKAYKIRLQLMRMECE